MVEGFWNFLEKNNNDIEDRPGASYPGQIREHSAALYYENGEIRIGPENHAGDVGSVEHGQTIAQLPNPVASIHTHPNAGKSAGPYRGTWKSYPSKGIDKAEGKYQKRYFDVVVSPSRIYFYNREEGGYLRFDRNDFKNLKK